jgi:hypothetical protein
MLETSGLSLMPGGVEIHFDLLQQVVGLIGINGRVRVVALEGSTPDEFQRQISDALRYLGSPAETEEMPGGISGACDTT